MKASVGLLRWDDQTVTKSPPKISIREVTAFFVGDIGSKFFLIRNDVRLLGSVEFIKAYLN